MTIVEPQDQESAPQVSEAPVLAPKPATLSPWRALTMGMCGVALLCAVTPYNDYRIKNTPLYSNHLPLGGLFLLAVLTLAVNPLLRRWRPRWTLKPGELLLFWVMASTGAGLAAAGLWRYRGPMV